jgi:hypothetical protein
VAQAVERYLPERAYARGPPVAGAQAGAAGSAVERPVRLLARPRRLEQVQGEWSAPERVSGEWWRDPRREGFRREYYRVRTESGEELWVFVNRKAEKQELYLHGYFD